MSYHKTVYGILVRAVALSLVAGCGQAQRKMLEDGPRRIPWPSEDRVPHSDEDLPPYQVDRDRIVGSGGMNNLFWLDFDGADVTSAESFIVKKAGLSQTFVPPFSGNDIHSSEPAALLKESIVAELMAMFPEVDIRFTTLKPIAKAFSRVHIGGNNFTNRPRVLGIAPLDLGNLSGGDVLFIFSRDLGRSITNSPQTLMVHVIAHEIAHALGARHIDNNRAVMKPTVALEANSFDQSGPVISSPGETENSLEVLKNTTGQLASHFEAQDLPNIVDLASYTTSNVVQYTVISRKNFLENPRHRLSDFQYAWKFDGETVGGMSVLMKFDDREDHLLEVEVSNELGASRSFQFSVGRRM